MDIQTNIDNDNYNIWRKDRKDKKGGGVMLMITSKIQVKNVENGKGKAELIIPQIKTKYGERQKIVVAYVPPKIKTWIKEHEQIIIDTLVSLEKIIKSSQRVTMVGDFNCNEVMWEKFDSGGENTWKQIIKTKNE